MRLQDKAQVLADVREIIAEQLGTELDAVSAESKFVDLGADSLDTVEIMMALEEKFDLQLDEEGAEKISTVQEAADLIVRVSCCDSVCSTAPPHFDPACTSDTGRAVLVSDSLLLTQFLLNWKCNLIDRLLAADTPQNAELFPAQAVKAARAHKLRKLLIRHHHLDAVHL